MFYVDSQLKNTLIKNLGLSVLFQRHLLFCHHMWPPRAIFTRQPSSHVVEKYRKPSYNEPMKRHRQKSFYLLLIGLALGLSTTIFTPTAHAACEKRCPDTQKDAQGCCAECDDGKARTKSSQYACCWPGQSWSKTQNQCIGIPQCPPNTTLKQGKTSKAKRADIKRLLVLTGSVKLAMLSVDRLIQSYKNLLPQVPATFWTRFKKQFNQQALIDLIVPIYDKHLTHADIKTLLAFYQSDVGKKYIKVMPDIQRESKIVGQQWGVLIAQNIELKLKEEGYLKKGP